MLLGIIPISFRFRGKLRRLAQIYQCFVDHPGTGMHPTQIARHTGMGFSEVHARLQATPELFVKLPRRPDGITRYRLTSSMAAKSAEDVEKFLIANARRETLILYAFGAMVVLNKPFIVPDLCIGGGICEAECPVQDQPAVYVTAVGESRSNNRKLLLRSRTPARPI